jgi:hypothetical protein
MAIQTDRKTVMHTEYLNPPLSENKENIYKEIPVLMRRSEHKTHHLYLCARDYARNQYYGT